MSYFLLIVKISYNAYIVLANLDNFFSEAEARRRIFWVTTRCACTILICVNTYYELVKEIGNIANDVLFRCPMSV